MTDRCAELVRRLLLAVGVGTAAYCGFHAYELREHFSSLVSSQISTQELLWDVERDLKKADTPERKASLTQQQAELQEADRSGTKERADALRDYRASLIACTAGLSLCAGCWQQMGRYQV